MAEIQVEVVIIVFFLFITVAYALLTLYMWVGWLGIRPLPIHKNNLNMIRVSVVVAVRNEEERILDLLQDLNKQHYPHECIEVIIIDDHSSDATVSLVREFTAKATYRLRLYKLNDYLQEPLLQGNYKKKAIELAVRMATGKLIITTDGDCRVGEKWLDAIVHTFVATDAKLISGAVTFYGEKTLFEKLQTIEFASLIGSGAATLALGVPTMCNGANMAYTKEAFLQVRGYEKTAGIASGDDIFLMHKIYKAYPGQACFLKSKDAIVYTRAKENWAAFQQQRKRWASKWNMYQDKRVSFLAMFIFLSNFSLLLTLILMLSGYYPLSMFLIQITVKFSVEFVFLASILRYLNKQQLIGLIFLLQFIYFLYVSFFGIISNKKGYRWKGRNLQ